jgi:hypothetical protein
MVKERKYPRGMNSKLLFAENDPAIPLDDDGNELIDLDGIPIPINPDGTITLYHRTTPENAEKIKNTGRFISLENTNEAFFSSKPTGQAEGYGDAIVAIKIYPNKVRINDAFHGGEVHVAVPVNRISKRNVIDTFASLISN